MLTPTQLTPTQLAEYRQRGFLVFERQFARSDLQPLRQAIAEVVDAFDIDAHRTVFTTDDQDRGRDEYFFASAEAVHCFLEADALDDSGRLHRPKHRAINKVGHALHDQIPAYTQFCRRPLFGQLLRDLGLQNPQLWQTMYIFKQPQIGGEVRWHQDASYLLTRPQAVVGMWLALEDATRENGCLWVHPGGHQSPLRERYEVDWDRGTATLRRLDDTPWPGFDQAVALEVPAGSLVVFHDHLPHYSAPNLSNASRHAFTMHAADASVTWCRENWLQRQRLGPFAL